MGILSKIFGGDPRKDMERARKLLASEPRKALELARKAAASAGGPAVKRPAQELVNEARAAVVAWAEKQADRAEESEYFEDAAEWLALALDEADGDVRARLEERREGLLEAEEKARAAARAAELELPYQNLKDDVESLGGDGEDEGPASDEEAEYDVLVGMMAEPLMERYLEQPPEFRRAVLALHEGKAEDALPTFDELISAAPTDPVRRLERGRARLLLDDPAGAAADLNVAWQHLGDGYLDLADQQSLPGLWAEAALEAGEAEAVIQRLAELADPRDGGADVALPFARALIDAERFDEAKEYLGHAVQSYPRKTDFPFLLSIVLDGRGQRQEAIQTLEAAVAPSCATGNCNAPPKHLPSLRSLARLHLEEGNLERVREVLFHVAAARGGALGAEEHRLSAEYFRRVGHDEAAEEAEELARQLAEKGPGAMAEPLLRSPTEGQKRSVL